VQEVSESNPAYFTLLFEDPNSGPNAFVFLPEVRPGGPRSADGGGAELVANVYPPCVGRGRPQTWDLYCGRASMRSHLLRMLARIWQSNFQTELRVNRVK